MIIYFANRKMDILGMASTELREGFTISDDLKTEETDTGVATFECTIHWDDSSRELAENCTSAGNYLLRSNEGENEFYTIIEAVNDTKNQSIDIYAEDAGMDLLNETVGAYEATSAHPAAWYIEMYAEDTGFEIGINEIENLSRTLKWEGEATAAERIASVATEFDNAEISYSFEIKNLVITHKYINIHQKRGKDVGYQLRLNRDVDRIVTTTSVADLATALYVTGGTPEGKDTPISLQGYSYDDGDIYVISGTPILCKRSALEVWSRYVWAKEPNQIEGYTGNIIKQWSYETTSQSELCNRAITQLNKVSEPAVNYEIDITTLPENVGIGDYVDIVDEKGELYLNSRILKLTTSVVNQKQTATLGDFLIKESGISETVKELAEQFAELAKSRQFYTWIAYADDEFGDGISLDPTGKTYMGTATNMTTAEVDISDPSVFTWALIQGEGVGIENIITWYGKSDSPTVVPTEWQDEPYELLRNEYQWSYVEYDYTNGVVVLTDPHIIAYYDYLSVDDLDAKVANIENLLAGNAGVGDLQAIYITGANAVIDDAVIVNALMGTVLADVLSSSVIYTDYIRIANNEDETLLIDGSTIQINDGTTVRVQMGLDSEGNYNFYILSADGDVIWDALGLTEAGLIGNGAIIKDIAVADDANISGYKLNLEEVVDIINEDGSLEIDASAVTIDGERLDYRLTSITEMVENLSLEGLKDWKLYFCLWYSATIPPYDAEDLTPAICGEAVCGKTICGVIDINDYWTLTEPTAGEGQYIWVRWWMLHDDDSEEWGDPFLLTDAYVRDHTTVLQTELSAVQGQITAKVWMDDIYETVDTAITTVWSEIDVQLWQITLEVGEIYTDLDEHYAKKASLVLQLDEATGIATLSADADVIELTGGQISIESDNFMLTKDGTIYATSGTIGGWVIGVNSLYNGTDSLTSLDDGIYLGIDGIREYNDGDYLNITSAVLENGNGERDIQITDGRISVDYNGTNMGFIYSANFSETSERGISMITNDSYLGIGYSGNSSNYLCYLLNNGLNPNGYTERNIFYSTTRFRNHIYTNEIHSEGAIYVENDIEVSGRITLASYDVDTGIYSRNIGRWMIYVNSAGDLYLGSIHGTYKPYYSAGDSISVTWYGCGYTTSSATLVRFVLPLRYPIVGSPSIKVSGTLTLRQNGSYTHGSSSSDGVTPSSWSTVSYNAAGLSLGATLSSTTNATNNAEIGIAAVLTITLS